MSENNQFSRTELLIGEDARRRLEQAKVAVFGIGGVGGFVCEALARAGVGSITIIDKDNVDVTNINRQIIALHSTIGRPKVEVMRERLLDINPNLRIDAIQQFYLPETAAAFDLCAFDYVVDAVDTVAAKLELAVRAAACGVPFISSMGAGNKLDPTRFEIADITKTSVCPLAKVMRRELKKRGIAHTKVVYSKEEPKKRGVAPFPSSISFVPSSVGLIIAGEVVKDLIKETQHGTSQG